MKQKVCTELIYLEPLSSEHIQEYMAAFSPTVQKILDVHMPESEREYLHARIEQRVPFFYVIKDKESGVLIGAIEIRDPATRSQLYCWLNEAWWGSGRFQQAIRLAAHNYFSQTNEDAITAHVDCDNLRSVHALQKAGFASHGTTGSQAHKQFVLLLQR